jgi:hypothetical protein
MDGGYNDKKGIGSGVLNSLFLSPGSTKVKLIKSSTRLNRTDMALL